MKACETCFYFLRKPINSRALQVNEPNIHEPSHLQCMFIVLRARVTHGYTHTPNGDSKVATKNECDLQLQQSQRALEQISYHETPRFSGIHSNETAC